MNDYIPAPRLFKFELIVKEGSLEPKVIQLGFRLVADDGDLVHNIEDLREKNDFLSEIGDVVFDILHEEIGIGYSRYCHDIFVRGMKVPGKLVKSIPNTILDMNAIVES